MIKSLQCDSSIAARYHSATQIARVVSESWCSENLYCAACASDSLQQAPANTRAHDFRCHQCSETYQVKSQRRLNLARVTDGAYSAMLASVQQNTAPNVMILNYSSDWAIRNLILVPSLFFTESVLERRPPLSVQARRAGWVGCNLLLANVPEDGKIPLIRDSNIVPAAAVRAEYKRYSGLKKMKWSLRGWTMDVLRMARQIRKPEFTLQDVYKYEKELAILYPSNKNVRPKIRQQLQVLRDLKILEFLGGGQYRFLMGSPEQPARDAQF